MIDPPVRKVGLTDRLAEPEETQPGLDRLREAVARYAPWRWPGPATRRADAVAGLNVTVANVPDGLANAVLVGVSPVFGLYATMVGPLVGGLLSSTRLMVVTTTAAASLTAGQALSVIPGESRASALFIMVTVAGVIQATLGFAGAGRLMRFVSYSVTTGFLTGVAVLLVLSQLPTITGIKVAGANRVMQTIDLFVNVRGVELVSLAVAAATMVLAIFLPRTKLKGLGRLLAVIIPSALVFALKLDDVGTVVDIGKIPRSLPTPELPSLGAALDVLTGALAVAMVTLVQGAGVSQSVPNPDGSRSRVSRDFVAQGAANIASGFFQGLPVGGSVSATAVSVTAGARSRWASVLAGAWMIVIVIGAPALVGYVAMPALAALLILAGLSSLRWREITAVWNTRLEAKLAGGTTFLAMLFLPIQAAVGIGVVLSILVFVRESSADVDVVQLTTRDDGAIEEHAAPRELAGDSVTVLQVYGDLFYGGANTLADVLPRPHDSRPVVVLRLRGRARIGATLIDVLTRYADGLRRLDGKLYLAGVAPEAAEFLTESPKLQRAGVEVFEATPVLGDSMRHAVAKAEAWLNDSGRE
jgi:sulfate permease, SulP family